MRTSDLPSASRLVMLVLADVADNGTAEIPDRFTPSLTVLTAQTGLDRRTVQRHLQSLEETGWVKRSRPASAEQWSGERVKYRLLVPIGVVAYDRQGGGIEPPGVVAESPKGGGMKPPLSPKTLKEPLERPRARGTRIPDDFTVTPKMREWAMANVPQLAGSRETEKFINHWQSVSGARGVKLDWVAAWRNWMLRAAEFAAARASPSTAPQRIPKADRCPEHPDQRAADCGHCRARRLAKPRREP